jgi:hypothetical protein
MVHLTSLFAAMSQNDLRSRLGNSRPAQMAL